ncbi:MAG TPA: RHS repeat-associated core domain-containing protein, partial [Chitinispirillaceae bacterium]|nr:RHS repeat-associated core domain-containing protein [Chitinispirillaceae bacterium]
MRVASVASNGDKLYLIDKSLPYGQVIAEYDSTGSLKCGYVYGLERISQRRNGGVHYYAADGQGSIRALTDTAGTITDTYFYNAFGEELAKTGTTENEFRYVGEQWDPNAGFYYLRARWYDQSTGRFASVDPFGGKVRNPLTFHKYLYCASSPIMFLDPSGRSFLVGTTWNSYIVASIRERQEFMAYMMYKKLIMRLLITTAVV